MTKSGGAGTDGREDGAAPRRAGRALPAVRLALACVLAVGLGSAVVRGALASPAPAESARVAGTAGIGASEAAAAMAAPAASGVRVSLAEVFFIQRHPSTGEVEWLGSAIIWFLLGLSAANLALTAGAALDNRRGQIAPGELMSRVAGLLRDRRADDAMDFLRQDSSYYARVMESALGERAEGYAAMVRGAEDAGQELALRRLRRVEPLNIIGNVAPMIGLFGTVYGMIVAFQEIVSAGGTPDPVNLAAGIGTALVTTFWGLIVAIPALSAYAFLRTRIDELTAEASRRADEALEAYRPAEPARS